MPIQPDPKVPQERIPFYVDGVLDIQRRAAFWVRWSVFASVIVGAFVLWLTIRGDLYWMYGIPFFLAPLLPISAQTRLDELRRKVLDQVRDVENERIRKEAVQGS